MTGTSLSSTAGGTELLWLFEGPAGGTKLLFWLFSGLFTGSDVDGSTASLRTQISSSGFLEVSQLVLANFRLLLFGGMDLSLRGMGLGMLVRRLTRTEETSVEVWVFSVVSDGSQQLLSLSLTPLNINRYGH